jgi:hypothetical protein
MIKIFPNCINSSEKVFFSLNHNSLPKVLSYWRHKTWVPKIRKSRAIFSFKRTIFFYMLTMTPINLKYFLASTIFLLSSCHCLRAMQEKMGFAQKFNYNMFDYTLLPFLNLWMTQLIAQKPFTILKSVNDHFDNFLKNFLCSFFGGINQ